tara:strand:- start:1017 stop:2024 length:1008 start_codon:yes stop_codon:yes gene_type:complete
MSEIFSSTKKIDLVGIGNAIVDIVTNVDDEFLEKNRLKKGSMNLISLEDSNQLLKNCEIIKQTSGGSAANTVVSLANLGNDVEFIGRIKDDAFGNFFSNNIKESGARFNSKAVKTNTSSAHSLIFITPDAQRTMCTYLGASTQFESNNINYESIKKSKYLYLEGYLWDSELTKKAFIQAAKIAKESKTGIILSLSDSFCVDRHRKSFINLIKDFIDILFCNEEEIKSLFELVDLQQCQKEIQSICDLTAITLGERGSMIISKNNEEFIEPKPLGKVIDTTGAGDIYAGGFIHGLINNFSLKDCGNLGSICAGHIVTQIGSRSDIKLKDLIRDYLN